MRVFAFVIFAALSALSNYASEPTRKTDSTRPSVADTKTVEFIGKKFELKFKATDKPTRIYEYFLDKETPDNWLELVEFQIYPIHPEGNEPMDHAARTANSFKKTYPYMQFALFSEEKGGGALLDFLCPESSSKEKGKDYLEFNAFKFFRDSGSDRTMSFHYTKNIEYTKEARTTGKALSEIKKTRQDIIPAMAKFPLYRQWHNKAFNQKTTGIKPLFS